MGHSIEERGWNSALKRGKELIVAGDVTVAKPALRPSRRNQPAWALKGGLARLHSRLARQVCPGRPVPACRQSMQHTSSPIQPTAHWPRRDPPPDAQKQSPVSMKLPILCANCRTRVKREGDCRQSRSAFANRAKPKAHRDLAGYSECRRLHFSDADGNAIRRRIRVRKNGSIFHRSTFVGLQIF